MRKLLAVLLLAVLAVPCLSACDDDRDYQLYKATIGLKESIGAYDEEEDGPRNWEYERRMVEERVDKAIQDQADLLG